MRVSFSHSKETTRFIVTCSEVGLDGSTRILYAEEHDADESLLEVTNRIRFELGYPAIQIGKKEER